MQSVFCRENTEPFKAILENSKVKNCLYKVLFNFKTERQLFLGCVER